MIEPVQDLSPREQLIRLAAFIDGEGCIMATYGSEGKGTRRVVVKVTVTNTDARLMAWLQETYGGGVSAYQRPPNRTRYTWQIKNRDLIPLLTAVGPFLILKREQADVALAILATIRPRGQQARDWHGRNAGLPEAELVSRETLRDRMRVLNGNSRRGPERKVAVGE